MLLFLSWVVFGWATAHADESGYPNVASHPNIVMILADDLGYGDLGCYGAPDTQSPYSDRLAAEGMLFKNFRANSSVCSPSRASFMSGMYPDRAGVPGVIRTHAEDSWGRLSPHLDTLPQLLKTAGYHTALVGKWHLGLESPDLPNDRGFDHFHGFLGDMMDDYYTHRRHDINYMRENKTVIDPQGHATDLFTDWACDYIKNRSQKPDTPFFLYLAYNAPHCPIQPRNDWFEKVRNREPNLAEPRIKILALMEHLDDAVGKVLETLEQTGLAKNTIIVFSSDNGGDIRFASRNGDLRDGKGTMYEGGLRVPCIVRWPGHVPSGTQTDVFATTMDLFPTFLQAAGCEKTPKQTVDGVSLHDVITGQSETLPNRELYFVRREGGDAFFGNTSESVIVNGWKLVHNTPQSPLELFSLNNDPSEQNDLKSKQSERFRELRGALQKHIQRGGQVPWQ